MDCSPPGSPGPGILQARTLERVMRALPTRKHERSQSSSLRTVGSPQEFWQKTREKESVLSCENRSWVKLRLFSAFLRFVHDVTHISALTFQKCAGSAFSTCSTKPCDLKPSIINDKRQIFNRHDFFLIYLYFHSSLLLEFYLNVTYFVHIFVKNKEGMDLKPASPTGATH